MAGTPWSVTRLQPEPSDFRIAAGCGWDGTGPQRAAATTAAGIGVGVVHARLGGPTAPWAGYWCAARVVAVDPEPDRVTLAGSVLGHAVDAVMPAVRAWVLRLVTTRSARGSDRCS